MHIRLDGVSAIHLFCYNFCNYSHEWSKIWIPFIAARAPKVSPLHFADELSVGMRTAVTCTVIDGEPPFKFMWYKDGSHLQENNRVSIKSHEFASTLMISDLGPESNGNYTCRVTNDLGVDEKFSLLNMKGENLIFKWYCRV